MRLSAFYVYRFRGDNFTIAVFSEINSVVGLDNFRE